MCNSGLYGTRFVSVKGTAASFLVLAIGAALVSAYMTVSRACADGEPAYELEEMVVTAGRIPTTFSNITRSVVVIGRDDIRTAPVHSVQDLLQYALGVDVRQRGPLGVQADVAVRGGTFEQTLILVDGTKVSDPQTGHHNLDLPLALEDIERVEILKGQGSRLYGPNAFGGVINIITRKREHKAARLEALAGDYGLREGTVSLSHPLGTSSHHLSLSKRTSGGYRAATDFDISTVSYGFSIPIGPGMSDLSFGYMAKEFGANSFYSDKYPNEWENTNTTFLSAGFYLEEDRFSFSSKFHWRRHGDDFLLDRERPAWYRNRHTTDLSGVDLLFLFPSRLGTTAFGGEAGKEGIESSNLGNHSRTKEGFFVEHKAALGKRLTLVPGAFACHYPGWGWRVWPGVDVGFQLAEGLRLYGSVGHSFRVPTYTELYYSDPANMGNSDLQFEEAWTYESGLDWRGQTLAGNLTLFRRGGSNLIDWVRPEPADPWEARNIARVNTNGVEMSLAFTPVVSAKHFPRIRTGYAFLDSGKETKGIESKYVLDQLRHQFLLDVAYSLFHNLEQSCRLRYECRSGQAGHFLLDARISWKHKRMEPFVEATNVLNTTYMGVGSIPMPGRWILGGLKLGLLEK